MTCIKTFFYFLLLSLSAGAAVGGDPDGLSEAEGGSRPVLRRGEQEGINASGLDMLAFVAAAALSSSDSEEEEPEERSAKQLSTSRLRELTAESYTNHLKEFMHLSVVSEKYQKIMESQAEKIKNLYKELEQVKKIEDKGLRAKKVKCVHNTLYRTRASHGLCAKTCKYLISIGTIPDLDAGVRNRYSIPPIERKQLAVDPLESSSDEEEGVEDALKVIDFSAVLQERHFSERNASIRDDSVKFRETMMYGDYLLQFLEQEDVKAAYEAKIMNEQQKRKVMKAVNALYAAENTGPDVDKRKRLNTARRAIERAKNPPYRMKNLCLELIKAGTIPEIPVDFKEKYKVSESGALGLEEASSASSSIESQKSGQMQAAGAAASAASAPAPVTSAPASVPSAPAPDSAAPPAAAHSRKRLAASHEQGNSPTPSKRQKRAVAPSHPPRVYLMPPSSTVGPANWQNPVYQQGIPFGPGYQARQITGPLEPSYKVRRITGSLEPSYQTLQQIPPFGPGYGAPAHFSTVGPGNWQNPVYQQGIPFGLGYQPPQPTHFGVPPAPIGPQLVAAVPIQLPNGQIVWRSTIDGAWPNPHGFN